MPFESINNVSYAVMPNMISSEAGARQQVSIVRKEKHLLNQNHWIAEYALHRDICIL